jgi:hypothetical protein
MVGRPDYVGLSTTISKVRDHSLSVIQASASRDKTDACHLSAEDRRRRELGLMVHGLRGGAESLTPQAAAEMNEKYGWDD